MQCVTPMIRYYQDVPKSYPEEKLAQRIIPRNEVFERLQKNENLIRGLQRLNDDLEKKGSVWRYQAIPCQHCYACKLRYSADWAIRIMKEVEKTEHNYFVTFTYDELNLPIATKSHYEGQTWENPGDWTGTLEPKDINKFLNTLRKRFERKGHDGIKYFYCGEYCPTSGRPHYHMILMNCPLDITQFYSFKLDPTTKKLHWKSKELDEVWKNKGFIDISEVTFASAAYVARYCMKKLSDEVDKTKYFEQGKLPEFVRMSRRPGIGVDFFNENHKNIYTNDSILMKNFHGEIAHYKPPKAWDKKFKELYPEEWEKIKISREEASKRSQELINSLTDKTDLEQMDMRSREIYTKGNQLKRTLEYDFN